MKAVIIKDFRGNILEMNILSEDTFYKQIEGLHFTCDTSGYELKEVSVQKATVLKRYDSNGSFTGDRSIELGIYNPIKSSMYKVSGFVYLILDESNSVENVEQCHKCDKFFDNEEDGPFCPHCLTSL